ncbi:apolipoprotein A-IV [Labrus bergylta]|uniref:Apolipoprotein A-IV n=1 Tax=Labrus bergylta TaxID=56723 RepID=A0A3Q3FT33_9LABR|nr:apolipoprotein A-I-like [Labrus bergylta]XP_020497899.1 apolipoprotein A-I-like [Labrus bergylta]
MKVLVLLALFSVCNANILWAEQPKNNLDMVKDAFWEYVSKVTMTAEDNLRQIRASELGQEVNDRISQSADAVNQYVVALKSQVAPLTQNFMTQFTKEAEQFRAQLESDLSTGTSTLRPYAEDLMARIQKQVEELKMEAAPYTESMDPESLKSLLLQKSQELKVQVDKSVSQLQAQMVPITEEMKEKVEQSMDQFQRSMMPLAQTFETQLAQKTQEMEELRAKLDASAQDMQAQLTALWESFIKSTQ